MRIRIAEIEIELNYVQEYYSILQVNARTSLLTELIVKDIFPMFQKENLKIDLSQQY